MQDLHIWKSFHSLFEPNLVGPKKCCTIPLRSMSPIVSENIPSKAMALYRKIQNTEYFHWPASEHHSITVITKNLLDSSLKLFGCHGRPPAQQAGKANAYKFLLTFLKKGSYFTSKLKMIYLICKLLIYYCDLLLGT